MCVYYTSHCCCIRSVKGRPGQHNIIITSTDEIIQQIYANKILESNITKEFMTWATS